MSKIANFKLFFSQSFYYQKFLSGKATSKYVLFLNRLSSSQLPKSSDLQKMSVFFMNKSTKESEKFRGLAKREPSILPIFEPT